MPAPQIRRDMSYRKPVPTYQPTPPPSPIPSLVGLLSVPTGDDIPSLPWRTYEQGQRASAQLSVPSILFHSDVAGQRSNVVDQPTPSATMTIAGSISHSPSGTLTPSSNAGTGGRLTASKPSKRLTHMSYRPPTPPIPAQHKRRRLTGAYPTEDDYLSPPIYTETNQYAPSDLRIRQSLRATPSFVTEKTFWSVNPSLLSSGRTTATGSYLLDSDKKPGCFAIHSEHTPKDMFRVDIQKIRPQETSTSGRTGGTLLELHKSMQKITSVLCC